MEEQINRYLLNQMSESEKALFENEMKENADLRKKVFLEKLIDESVQVYQSEAGFAQAKAIAKNLGDDLFTQTQTSTFEIDIDIQEKKINSFKTLFSKKIVYIPTLVAACFIMVLFGLQLLQTNNNSGKNPNEFGFTEDENPNTPSENRVLKIVYPKANQIYKTGTSVKIQLNKKIQGVKLLVGTKDGSFKKEFNNIFDTSATYVLSLKNYPAGKYALIIQAKNNMPQLLNFEVN